MQQTMFFNESIYREGGFTYHFFYQNDIKNFKNVFSSSDKPDPIYNPDSAS